ncbi:MAG TPA: S-layer protein domain-containing protein [Methanothrix sp.]|nr:S-layer protein domain-containing protein [Methanothrix sp.]
MEIRTIWMAAAAALLISVLCLATGAWGQEAMDAAYVRGHFSNVDGIWRADDFGWFYYDLDEDQGSEELTVHLTGRAAEEGDIVYTSKAWTSPFEYKPWGTFQEVAFLGSPYLAGYPESNFTEEVSSLGKGALRKVLIDSDEEYTLNRNASLPLLDSYVLSVAEVSSNSDVATLLLYKNGKLVHGSVVSVGGTYVYKIDDVPIILAHLSDAMTDQNNTAFAEIDGIFQVSDQPVVKLFEGGRLGNLKMTSLDDDGMEFRNERTLSLLKNSQVPLCVGLALTVADSEELIYYPVGGIYDYGIHEIRGPTFNGTQYIPGSFGGYPTLLAARWNSGNYTNFYMDPERQLGEWNRIGSEDQFGSETLVLYKLDGRTAYMPTSAMLVNGTAVVDGFMYSSTMRAKNYDYEQWGSYYVIPFLGNLWFAGYDKKENGKTSSQNLFDHEKIGQILIDREIVQKSLFAGNYSLEEGYEVRIRDVDEDKILIQLAKNGVLQDTSVVASNTTYIFKKDLGDVEDMPIIKLHVSNIFSNGSTAFATIDAIFQISDQFLFPVESGISIDKMQTVSTSQPYTVIMLNDENINLNRDSTISLAPNMNIRVADNDTLRYYLYSQQYVVPRPSPPQIKLPDNAVSGSIADFAMMVRAAEIRSVTADVLDDRNRTINSRNIAGNGRGSGEYWSFSWGWNATTLRLSDDNSLIMDAGSDPIPALLYLNSTAPARQVGVRFDAQGRISAIMDDSYIYYLSREEYTRLNRSLDYDAMQANETERRRILKIEPEGSLLQFIDVVDGRMVPGGANHTLQGSMERLEPHASAFPAEPGRYELRVRVENAIDAVLSFENYFNVTAAPVRGVALGSASAAAGESATVALLAGNSDQDRRINITYNATLLSALGISGGNTTWNADGKSGKASIFMPAGVELANLTFSVQLAAANQTALLEVTGTSGLSPEVRNGSIIILPGNETAKKSNAAGILASIFALAAACPLCRKRR